MSFSLISKGLVTKSLALAVAASMLQVAHANSSDAEIQQLRAEIQELRAIVQQQQAVQKVQAPSSVTTAKVDTKDLKLTTTSGAEVKLYGFVRGDVSYQAEGGNTIFNRIDAVALDGANNDKLYSTVNTTRLGFDFKTPVAGAEIGGKIEVDFRDDGTTDNKLRLRHGYLTYDNWLIGQTTSSFSNLEVMPEMLDFNLNLGSAYNRRAMVRYADNLASGTQYFVGLEKGDGANRLPTLTAKVNQSFAGDQGLVTGRAFVEQNRGTGINDSETATGWGAGAGVNFKLTPEFKVMADYMHVEGNKNLTMFANNASTLVAGELENNEFDVFSVGATYQINPQLRSTLGYGAMFAEDSNKFAQAITAANKELQQGWLNVMYSPVKPITFGLEYVYGERETFAGTKGKDNRVGAMARYSF